VAVRGRELGAAGLLLTLGPCAGFEPHPEAAARPAPAGAGDASGCLVGLQRFLVSEAEL